MATAPGAVGPLPHPVAVGEIPAPRPPLGSEPAGQSNGGKIFLPPGASVPTPGQVEAAATGAPPPLDATCHSCTSMQSGPTAGLLPGSARLLSPMAGADTASNGSNRPGCDAKTGASNFAQWLIYCVPGTNKALNPDCVVPVGPGVGTWMCGSIPNLDNPFTKAITQVADPEGQGSGLGRSSDETDQSSLGIVSAKGGAGNAELESSAADSAGGGGGLADAISRGDGEGGFIDPNSVRFSQDSISANFSNGQSVAAFWRGLANGSIKASDVPPIRLVERDGKLFTMDNRRLVAFQQARIPVAYRMASVEEAANEAWKFTTMSEGRSIQLSLGTYSITVDALSLVVQRGAERRWDWHPDATIRLTGTSRVWPPPINPEAL